MNNNRSSGTADKGKQNLPILATGSMDFRFDWTKGFLIIFSLSILIALPVLFPHSHLLLIYFQNASKSFVTSFQDLIGNHFDRFRDSFGFQRVYATSDMSESPLPNHPPTSYPGVSYTMRDTPIVLTLRGTDQDGDALTFFPSLLSTKTAHGKVGSLKDYSTSSSMTTARITYFPDPGYSGTDSFTYQAADESNAASNVATISLIIR